MSITIYPLIRTPAPAQTVTAPCAHCGRDVTRPRSKMVHRRRVYCSQACARDDSVRLCAERRQPLPDSGRLVVGTRADGTRVVLAECRPERAERLAQQFREQLEGYASIDVEPYCIPD